MKWPHGPQFVVGSLSGYRLNPRVESRYTSSHKMPTLWYVNDAARCYGTLLETWKETEARALAERLNG
jgi:hypothetical protein